MNKQIKIIITIFVMILLNIKICFADSINIGTRTTNVANLYYEVINNGKHLKQDVNFKLYNENKSIIYKGKTKNSIVFVEKVPFGKYLLSLNINGEEKFYNLTLDLNYVSGQHVLKEIEFKKLNKNTKFSEENIIKNIEKGIKIFNLWWLILIIILIYTIYHNNKKKLKNNVE